MFYTFLTWIKSHALLSAVAGIAVAGSVATVAIYPKEVPAQKLTPTVLGTMDPSRPAQLLNQVQLAQPEVNENNESEGEKESESQKQSQTQNTQSAKQNTQLTPENSPVPVQDETQQEQGASSESISPASSSQVPEPKSDELTAEEKSAITDATYKKLAAEQQVAQWEGLYPQREIDFNNLNQWTLDNCAGKSPDYINTVCAAHDQKVRANYKETKDQLAYWKNQVLYWTNVLDNLVSSS